MSYNEKSVADQQPQLPVPANAPPPVPNVDTIQVTGVTQHEIGSEKASEPPSYSHSTDDSDMTLQTGRPNTIDKSGVYETPSDPRTLNHVLSLKDLREEPDFVDCPHCKSRQKTRVTHPDSSATTLSALFCCLFCGVITVCIPSLCHWFAETDHYCSQCNKLVAHKAHDGQMEPRLPQAREIERYKASAYQGMSKDERQGMEGEK